MSVSQDRSMSHCHSHAVHFYTDLVSLGAHVAAYLSEGIQTGEAVFAIATREVHYEIKQYLQMSIPQLETMSNYKTLDADELLSTFLVNAQPDRSKFFEAMDRIFAKPAGSGRSIRVYGEMVVRLWHAGQPEAALQLEDFWNLLAERYNFSLLCAYPMSLFDRQHIQWFLNICATHSQLSANSGIRCR
ncbi:MAG: sensor hybrid histidine kinase [Nitrospira sp.]|jgi:hypothetical protein|nr:sensor hybrid histidine kinase [Nitrospira sp.]